MKLSKLKEIPYQIAQVLADNENIVRLLYCDSASVLTTQEEISISVNQLIEENYIGFYPATETGINNIERNTFIIINLEDINLHNSDSNVGASGAIYITTDKSHSVLNNGKLRLLELADEIDTTLEGQKFSTAGQLRLSSVNYVVFSDFRSGYRINFRIYDQQARKAEL